MATRGQWEEYKNHGRKWKFLGNLKVGAGKEITRKKKKRLSFWRQWGKQGWGAEQTSNSCLPHLSMGLNTVFVVSCTFLFYLECVLWAYVLFYNFTKLSSFSGCPSSGFFSFFFFFPLPSKQIRHIVLVDEWGQCLLPGLGIPPKKLKMLFVNIPIVKRLGKLFKGHD